MKLFEMFNKEKKVTEGIKGRRKELTKPLIVYPNATFDRSQAKRLEIGTPVEMAVGGDNYMGDHPQGGTAKLVAYENGKPTTWMTWNNSYYEAISSRSVTEDEEEAGISSDQIVQAWMQEFPNSSVHASKAFGGGTAFKFRLAKDKSEVSSQIMDNDPLNYTALLDENGNWKEWSSSMFIAPPEGSYLAYGSAKFRKKSAKNVTLPQIQKRFKQVKEFVAQNADKLHQVNFDINEKLGRNVTEAEGLGEDASTINSKDPKVSQMLKKARINYAGSADDDLSALVSMMGDEQEVQDTELGSLDRYNNVQDLDIDQEEHTNNSQEAEINSLDARISKLERSGVKEDGIGKAIKKGVKSLKRSFSGWDGMTSHREPADSSEPYNMARRHAELPTDELKKMDKFHKGMGSNNRAGTPQALSAKLTKRNLRKRGERDFEKYMNEAEEQYGVYPTGGSIGRASPKPYKTFDNKPDAQAYANRMRKQLTKGERGYYKMGYTVKPIKAGINESEQSEAVSQVLMRLQAAGGGVYEKAFLQKGEETAILAQNGHIRFAIFQDGKVKRAKKFIEFQRDGWEIEMNLGEAIVPYTEKEGNSKSGEEEGQHYDDETGQIFRKDEIEQDENGKMVEKPYQSDTSSTDYGVGQYDDDEDDDDDDDGYDIVDAFRSELNPRQKAQAQGMFGDIAAGGGDPIDYLMSQLDMDMDEIDALAVENGYNDANEWAESYAQTESIISASRKLNKR